MGKLYLYFRKISHSDVNNVFKIKIDDQITFEGRKNEISGVELVDGVHNIKMYSISPLEGQLFGYTDTTIEVSGDTYYIVTPAFTDKGKMKLKRATFNSLEEFNKYASKTNTKIKILGVGLFILAILFIIFLS